MKPKNDGKTKQVILIRKDLEMPKGKLGAQTAHASIAAFLNREKTDPISNPLSLDLSEADIQWLSHRFTKICLGVKNEEELLKYYELAKSKGLKCSLIKDAGFTTFNEPTHTTVAIGPDFNDVIDEITGKLKIYREKQKK